MKTNHRRKFIDKQFDHTKFHNQTRSDKDFGIIITGYVTPNFTNGHRGEAKAKRGMKHYLNSRIRSKQKEYIKDIEKDIVE